MLSTVLFLSSYPAIAQRDPITKKNIVHFSEASSYTMTKMMQGVVDEGTAAGLRERLGAAEMGGKTGTTNDNSDAWFIGYSPTTRGRLGWS